ncbi:MAG TPA: hypothetical protein VHE35_05370 [Kofleriaceae bacterium]|nr:hypothetical protein [Kofleriaceae bacterium]
MRRGRWMAGLAAVMAAGALASGPAAAEPARPRRETQTGSDGPRLGVALKVDALGGGGDLALALGDHLALRAGVRALDVDQTYQLDGIDLDATLRLRSASAYLDWFPFGGSFHLSPGAMIYNGNRVTAAAGVPGGELFTAGGEQLLSSPMDPVDGRASIDFATLAPALVIGWGNLAPRRGSHWSVPFELGVVYSRAPSTTLALRGTACAPTGDDCHDIAREPLLQAAVRAEEARIDARLAPLKVLPVVSLGVGYRF